VCQGGTRVSLELRTPLPASRLRTLSLAAIPVIGGARFVILARVSAARELVIPAGHQFCID
jgi:hypothetical protein